VNVDAYQLQQSQFMARLRLLLARHPTFHPGCLELEIMETSALEDVEHVAQLIQACQTIGVNFTLDDFGTGYSSLTYLKRLPTAQLKIGHSFVRGMLDDPEDLAILEGVLGLAAAFRRQVIAQGVVSEAHGKMLLQLGCKLAQGSAIAKPMSAPNIIAWAQAWQPYPSWVQQRPINRENLPLLSAHVEHRAWINAVVDYLNGNRHQPPPLDHHACRFGYWLDHEGTSHYGHQPEFIYIVALHRQVHDLAIMLLDLYARGQRRVALQKLEVLFTLRDKLLACLQKLVNRL